MSRTLTIAAREMGSMFRLPAGWVVIALYALLGSIVVALQVLRPGEPATLRPFFALSGWLLLPVVPAISMRLISEELRAGTIEPLMTAPVTDASIVIGKYLGALGFFACMLLPTLAFPIVLGAMADPGPDLGQILAGYASLVAQGVLFLAIGTLASALTSNQTLAFLGTLFAILALLLAPALAYPHAPGMLRPILERLNVEDRVKDFARGIIDTSHVVFFAGAACVVLACAIVVVQSRRWR